MLRFIALFRLCFKLCKLFYSGVCSVFDLLCRPFTLLGHASMVHLDQVIDAPKNLNRRFSAFNGFFPFLLFIGAFLFVACSLCFFKPENYTAVDFLMHLMFNTTLGSFLDFFISGLDFSPAVVVAVPFSGIILSTCMRIHNPEGRPSPIYIRILCYIVYLAMSALLAIMFTNIFEIVGDWGYQTIHNILSATQPSSVQLVVSILLLIPLCYIALILLVNAVKEYTECAGFGVLGFLIFLLGELFIGVLTESSPNLGNILSTILILGIFFGMDILRIFALEKYKQKKKEEKNQRRCK